MPAPAPRNWDDAVRLIREGHEVENVIDALSAHDRREFEAFMEREGHRNSLAMRRHRETMKAIDDGTYSARATWHSISEAQRVALAALASGNGVAVRRYVRPAWYFLDGTTKKIGHARTIIALGERELVDWGGGVFEPWRRISISDKGRFVAKWGPTEGPSSSSPPPATHPP